MAKGELDQRRRGFAPDGDLLSGFVATTGLLAEESRSVLAKFGLGAEHVMPGPLGRFRRANGPGPGWARLMATGTNCLVLDEPTNHLDLPAIEQLEQALEHFDGTLLVVTHDRWLLETPQCGADMGRRGRQVLRAVTRGPVRLAGCHEDLHPHRGRRNDRPPLRWTGSQGRGW